MSAAIATCRVRPARPSDVGGIARLVGEHVRRGDLLPRTPEDIQASLPDWAIALEAGRVIACGSLVAYGQQLAEVRSVAVDDVAKGRGVGTRIVGALVDMGRARKIDALFTLTRAVPFFARCGFQVTGREQFPAKVWRDCRICPLLECCDETAMVLHLSALAVPGD
jgi:amino-acid N-acetyltransferase